MTARPPHPARGPRSARLTGLFRDLLHDIMRHGNLPNVKNGRRRLITCDQLEQFLGIASGAGRPSRIRGSAGRTGCDGR